jgi:hypothetical protein
MVHYRVHRPTLPPTLSQITPVYAIPSCLFNIHFNIILSHTHIFYEWSLTFRFLPPQLCLHFCSHSYVRPNPTRPDLTRPHTAYTSTNFKFVVVAHYSMMQLVKQSQACGVTCRSVWRQLYISLRNFTLNICYCFIKKQVPLLSFITASSFLLVVFSKRIIAS